MQRNDIAILALGIITMVSMVYLLARSDHMLEAKLLAIALLITTICYTYGVRRRNIKTIKKTNRCLYINESTVAYFRIIKDKKKIETNAEVMKSPNKSL